MLAAPLGGPVEIRDLRRLPGGASRSTWSCDAESSVGDEVVPLIFQQERTRATGAGGGLATGAALRRRAGSAGVPVAEVVIARGAPAADAARGALGPPWMVMRRMEGEPVPRRIFR